MIYSYTDYRRYLKDAIKLQRQLPSGLSLTALATAARVQRSYLSHVLAGRAGLNPDQLFQIAHVLGLDDDAVEYLLILLEIDRCQFAKRREQLLSRRNALRQKGLRTEVHLTTQPDTTTAEQFPLYYSDPDYSLVHMFLSI